MYSKVLKITQKGTGTINTDLSIVAAYGRGAEKEGRSNYRELCRGPQSTIFNFSFFSWVLCIQVLILAFFFKWYIKLYTLICSHNVFIIQIFNYKGRNRTGVGDGARAEVWSDRNNVPCSELRKTWPLTERTKGKWRKMRLERKAGARSRKIF